MVTEGSDLLVNIKEKFLEELRVRKLELDNYEPIGISDFVYVYRIRCTVTGNLEVCKVILIPEYLQKKAKVNFIKTIEKDVIKNNM